MRSAKGHRQISCLGVFAICGLLLVGGLTGCSTTQEKAAQQQARSKRILEAREKRSHKR